MHEIKPTVLHDFINGYIATMNSNSIISILEVGQLTVGEDDLILLYPDAIAEILQTVR
ncbi:MAG: hypothetical protein ACK5LL_00275 [Suipraeoptans sp.]